MKFFLEYKLGFGITIIFWLLFWVGLTFVGVKGYNYIQKHGLKNIIHNVWEGESSADTTKTK